MDILHRIHLSFRDGIAKSGLGNLRNNFVLSAICLRIYAAMFSGDKMLKTRKPRYS